MKIERLRLLREKEGISQSEAAKRMGIVRPTYSNYEAGNREPDIDTLKKMASFYGTTVGYLLGEEDEPSNNQVNDELLSKFKKLPAEKRKLISDMIDALSDEQP